jgi:GntR family transcriptional regulator, transcriptional repressor for pyruvate dehydrogenase complex
LSIPGLIEVRQGVNGGVNIVEVDPEVARETLCNFLYFKDLTLHNVSEAMRIIEPYTARIAAERLASYG